MYYTIGLINGVANQSFFVKTNGHTVHMRISNFRDMTFADVEIDGEVVVSGKRLLPCLYIIPKRYEDILGGNFFFSTKNDSYIDFEEFNGVDSVLWFEGDNGEDNE